MRRAPDDPAILDKKGLRRLVPDAETVGNLIRQFAILDDENETAREAANAFREIGKLLVGLGADRTLRAMLENHDWIFVGTFQQLLQVLFLM